MTSTHRRRSIRLPHHDYLAGIYFVTICTAERRCLFGQVVGGVVVLNDLGQAVQAAWEDLARRFPHVDTSDAFVVMPNHVHGNIALVPWDPPRPLGAVMGAFKLRRSRRVDHFCSGEVDHPASRTRHSQADGGLALAGCWRPGARRLTWSPGGRVPGYP